LQIYLFAPFIFARYNVTVWQMHLIKSLKKKVSDKFEFSLPLHSCKLYSIRPK